MNDEEIVIAPCHVLVAHLLQCLLLLFQPHPNTRVQHC